MKKIFFWVSCIIPFSITFAFSDVLITDANVQSISYLAEKGVLSGYANGTLDPQKEINRAEALKIIFTAGELDIPNSNQQIFGDVPIDSWFAKYVALGVAEGVISTQHTNYNPAQTINRAEFIKIMLKTFQIDPTKFTYNQTINDISGNEWFAPYINFAIKFGIINLTNSNALPAQTVTRANAAKMIFILLDRGKGLNVQTLLSLTEKRIITALELLKEKKINIAGLEITSAENYTTQSLTLKPKNKIVLSAEKTTKAVKSIIGAYSAGENGRLNDILITTNSAWNFADEATKLNPERIEFTNSIKKIAHDLTNKAREIKAEALSQTQAKP